MIDTSVQDIIATFKGIEKKDDDSIIHTENFANLMQAKKAWTLDEYKEVLLEYSIQNMKIKFMDSMIMEDIANKNNFTLDWNHHFNVIEHIKSNKKDYINYYFWYYYIDMTEEVYQQFMKKPYFSLLTSKSKIQFLSHKITTDNENSWIIDYFTHEEIKNGLKKNSLKINLHAYSNNTNLEPEVKKFYHQFEQFMTDKTKVKFFNDAARTGVVSLIKFLYKEKNIRKINTVQLLWHVCGDTASKNTLEILQCLKDLGIKLTPSVLKKSQEDSQWGYMEHTDELVSFIMDAERQKNYAKLNKKLKNKAETTNVRKV